VDRRSVLNHAQARALLAAVQDQKPSGERLVAFFALMYYAALRPEEAINLRTHNIALPPLVLNKETGQMTEPTEEWGELRLTKSAPFAGRERTDDGTLREERSLKHRADGHSRHAPIPPALSAILRARLAATYGKTRTATSSGARAAESCRYHLPPSVAKARTDALTPDEATSPQAKRVYDLRHACVSTWLNAGVPATQVAEWADTAWKSSSGLCQVHRGAR
jgi:integrase